MRSPTEYLESLSPWPKDGFGLDRMKQLLAALGEPQLRYPSVHVVGTNGKSTVTRTTEALLAREGLTVGAFVSPHIRGWSERIRVARSRGRLRRSGRAGAAGSGAARGDAVRDPDRRCTVGVRAGGSRRRRSRGRARWALRRDQRSPLAGAGSDERRARAHRGARRHARGDRRREARGRPAGRDRRPRRAGMGRARARERRRPRSWLPARATSPSRSRQRRRFSDAPSTDTSK